MIDNSLRDSVVASYCYYRCRDVMSASVSSVAADEVDWLAVAQLPASSANDTCLHTELLYHPYLWLCP